MQGFPIWSKRLAACWLALLAGMVMAEPTKPTSPTVVAKTKVALVIGNSNYARGPLINPVNDATDMAAGLSGYGFEVIRVLDGNKQKMRDAVRQFTEKLGPKTVAILFYAGHGMQINGKNYLVPTDANVKTADDVDDQSVSLDWIMQRIAARKPRFNFVILDACRNNPFERSFGGGGGLAAVDGPAGSLIAFATGPSKVASDGGDRNGLYTSHLLRHMNTPNILVEEVFKRVRIGVMEQSGGAQVPWENSSLTEDFVLNDKGGPKTATQSMPISAIPDTAWTASAGLGELKSFLMSRPLDSGRDQATLAFAQANAVKPLRTEALKLSTKDCDQCPKLTELSTMVGGEKLFFGTDLVTVEEYQQCVTAGACRVAKPSDRATNLALAAYLPVTNISLNDANRYIQWVNTFAKTKHYRLPAQDEWLAAFKSGYFLPSGRILAATKSLCDIGNFYDISGAVVSSFPWSPKTCNDGFPSISPVGAFMPSLDGLFDLVGNLWQWTTSCQSEADATKPSKCAKVRLVGGSWATAPRWSWTQPPELAAEPDLATDLFGIRVVASGH